jgi:glyoxylase-like metal-dependent hydrolase (beta-lactamase superfamily II)
MLLSEVVLPDYHPRAGAACVVFGFVIHHAEGPVLVDTGVGTGHTGIDSLFAPVHHSIEDAMANMGVRPTDVKMVINSHLHFDHCGNNRLWPGIPIVVQRAEYESARQPGYTIPEWIDFPGAEWKPVDGEVEVLPGVKVLPTPGHTPGHQSVLITRAGGLDVIAGQALYDGDELDADGSIEPLTEEEAEQTSASARRIKAARPDRVFFSHDSRVWVPHRDGLKPTTLRGKQQHP